jgi:hypothetical protein
MSRIPNTVLYNPLTPRSSQVNVMAVNAGYQPVAAEYPLLETAVAHYHIQ